MGNLKTKTEISPLNWGDKSQAVTEGFLKNKKAGILAHVFARVLGTTLVPLAFLVESVASVVIGVAKLAVGLTITPVVRLWQKVVNKKELQTQWTIREGLFYLGQGVVCLLNVAVSIVLNTIDPRLMHSLEKLNRLTDLYEESEQISRSQAGEIKSLSASIKQTAKEKQRLHSNFQVLILRFEKEKSTIQNLIQEKEKKQSELILARETQSQQYKKLEKEKNKLVEKLAQAEQSFQIQLKEAANLLESEKNRLESEIKMLLGQIEKVSLPASEPAISHLSPPPPLPPPLSEMPAKIKPYRSAANQIEDVLKNIESPKEANLLSNLKTAISNHKPLKADPKITKIQELKNLVHNALDSANPASLDEDKKTEILEFLGDENGNVFDTLDVKADSNESNIWLTALYAALKMYEENLYPREGRFQPDPFDKPLIAGHLRTEALLSFQGIQAGLEKKYGLKRTSVGMGELFNQISEVIKEFNKVKAEVNSLAVVGDDWDSDEDEDDKRNFTQVEDFKKRLEQHAHNPVEEHLEIAAMLLQSVRGLRLVVLEEQAQEQARKAQEQLRNEHIDEPVEKTSLNNMQSQNSLSEVVDVDIIDFPEEVIDLKPAQLTLQDSWLEALKNLGSVKKGQFFVELKNYPQFSSLKSLESLQDEKLVGEALTQLSSFVSK